MCSKWTKALMILSLSIIPSVLSCNGPVNHPSPPRNYGTIRSVDHAEGIAAIFNEDIARARDEALRDAFRRAIEKQLGLFLDAKTIMENHQIIKDKIYTQVQGYIKSYEVINEWRDNDIYHIVIKASTFYDLIKADVVNLAITIKEVIGNPRVLVLISETNLGKSQPFSIVEAELRQILADKGFFLTAQEKVARDSAQAKRCTGCATDACLSLVKNSNSDILITGQAKTTIIAANIRGSSLIAVKARADICPIITQTGQILKPKPIEAIGHSLSREDAGDEALKNLALKLANSLVTSVVNAFNTTVAGNIGLRAVHLTVKRVRSYRELTKLKEAVENLRGVENVYQRSYEGQVAEFDIDLRIREEYFYARLENLQGIRLKIISSSMSNIEVEIVK